MKTEEKNIFQGTHIWKSPMEYHNEHTFMHGYPYYQISKIDDVYYLWELDLKNPDSPDYRIMKEKNSFRPLYDEGMELNKAIGQKYKSMNLYYLKGKELIEKLKSG